MIFIIINIIISYCNNYCYYYRKDCGLSLPLTLFLFPRQNRENAERVHEEEMASVTLSAQERQKELAVLLEQTEAQNQQRGQCVHVRLKYF